jgi:uncharacterized paraquat-inducible protein A
LDSTPPPPPPPIPELYQAESKLQRCPDCGQQVSKSAARCPHCGRELNTGQRFAMGIAMGLLAVIITGLLIVLFVIGLAFCSH